MAKKLNELSTYDNEFVTDEDIKDGFLESDASKAERLGKINPISSLKQGPSAANVKADNANINITIAPHFDFSKKIIERAKEKNKDTDKGFKSVPDGEDPFKPVSEDAWKKERYGKDYAKYPENYNQATSDMPEAMVSDLALKEQEDAEDRAAERMESLMKNSAIKQAMSKGESIPDASAEREGLQM